VLGICVASVLLLGLAAGGIWSMGQVAMVPSAVPAYMAVEAGGEHASLSSSTHAQQLRRSSSGPSWRDITPAQRQVLTPLRDRWDTMGALAKRRWLVLADRYPQMDESERNKLFSRMNTWASLSAQQRNQARLNFESAKRLSAEELQAKWDAYQALSEAEKTDWQNKHAKPRPPKKPSANWQRPPPRQNPLKQRPSQPPAAAMHRWKRYRSLPPRQHLPYICSHCTLLPHPASLWRCRSPCLAWICRHCLQPIRKPHF